MGFFGDNGGGIVSAAGSLLGSGINAISTGSMNKKTRKWNEKQYALQRENALADWNMQNEYNSPQNQMARLKAAGLNPNLVYGNGATATSTSTPRASAAPNWSPEAPKFDIGGASDKYFDTQIKQQTMTNMQAQERLIRQQELSAAADIISKGIATNRSKLAYDIEQATKENVIARSGLTNDLLSSQRNKSDQDTEFTIKSMERIPKQLEEMASRIAVNKAQVGAINQGIKNAVLDGKIKAFEIRLNKLGLTKSDPSYQRLLKELFDEIVETIQ